MVPGRCKEGQEFLGINREEEQEPIGVLAGPSEEGESGDAFSREMSSTGFDVQDSAMEQTPVGDD